MLTSLTVTVCRADSDVAVGLSSTSRRVTLAQVAGFSVVTLSTSTTVHGVSTVVSRATRLLWWPSSSGSTTVLSYMVAFGSDSFDSVTDVTLFPTGLCRVIS